MIKSQEITLAQANALTQARYDFTVVEKRAVYCIINEVRRQFIDKRDGQKDLFNDLIVKISTAELKGRDMELKEVYKSLKNLRKKSIWIADEKRVLEVGYINYFEHIIREPSLEVQVSHKILPYLVELAEQFTSYSLAIAISLKTKYAQRFYEYCSQFRKTGFFTVSPIELREKLMLGDAYPRYALVKKKVIDVAHKELKDLYEKGHCDLYFEYTEKKQGRTVERINITIITKESEDKEKPKLEDMIYFIKTWLYTWLAAKQRPKNKAWIDKVIKYLQLNANDIPKLYDRLVKMQKEQPNTSYAAFARYIIEEDYLSNEE
jgi:plasmid replication initiation protein